MFVLGQVLLWGCKLPPHIDSPESKRCSLEAEIDYDRDHGVAPLPVQLTAVSNCDASFEALWLFEDGTSQSGEVLDHTFLAAGIHRVELSLADAKGRSAAAEVFVEVGPAECPEQLDPVQLGSVENAELTEASGLSELGGVLWSHNDSGGTARLFALSAEGDDLGVYELQDAEALDWEDMTVDEGVLYVGDLGDNLGEREFVTVFLVDEPADSVVADWSSMTLTYPDALALDSNALMADPLTGDLYVVAEDAADDSWLYRKAAPHEADSATELELVTQLELDGKPTSGGFHPLGTSFVIRTTAGAEMWLRDGAETVAEAIQGAPCSLSMPDETAGEALAFSEDGGGIYTLGEGEAQPIWFIELVPQEQPCESGGPEIWALPAFGEVPLDVDFSVDCVDVDSVVWTLGGVTVEALTTEAEYLSSGVYPVVADVDEADGTRTQLGIEVVVDPASCPAIGARKSAGDMVSEEVIEASGVVESTRNPGVFWTHNDAGNAAVLFAFGSDGSDFGRFEVDDSARDWEDIAIGEIDGEPTLFVGDVGDNGESRDDYRILLVPEPLIPPLSDDPLDVLIEDFGEIVYTYPDGESFNCEAIALDPVTGALVIVTKNYDGHSKVFIKDAPHADGDVVELTWVADLELMEGSYRGSGAATAMDFSPRGDLIGIRTYTHLWLLRRDQADTLAESFAVEPCDGEVPSERQGEAMAFSVDGLGYWVVSEGLNQPVQYKAIQ